MSGPASGEAAGRGQDSGSCSLFFHQPPLDFPLGQHSGPAPDGLPVHDNNNNKNNKNNNKKINKNNYNYYDEEEEEDEEEEVVVYDSNGALPAAVKHTAAPPTVDKSVGTDDEADTANATDSDAERERRKRRPAAAKSSTTTTTTTTKTKSMKKSDEEEKKDREEKAQAEEDRFNETEKRARIALEAVAMRDADVEQNMSNYVAVLRAYRIACEQRQLYKEAYLVQQVLRNLQLEEETRHVRGLTDMQMDERRALEAAHREEFREFHRLWNEKIDDFEEAQLEMEIRLLERQNEELLRFHEQMRDYAPRGVPRFSRSLLAARQRQQALARQKSYVAAQEQKMRGDAIELMDMEKFETTRGHMYARREFALRYQHQQELLALRLKVEGKRLYLEKARKQELDMALQRYINARNEMEIQQNIIRNKTGALLLKHACNGKTDGSGSAALVESAYSGTYGTTIQRRTLAEQQERTYQQQQQQKQQEQEQQKQQQQEQQRTLKAQGRSGLNSPPPSNKRATHSITSSATSSVESSADMYPTEAAPA